MKEFLAERTVFTVEELDHYLCHYASGNISTRKSLLQYYSKQGRVVPVRRGLYLVVPLGTSPDSLIPDPYILACKLAPDATLAYHTALEFHRKAYSVYSSVTYLSARKITSFKFRNHSYKRVPIPPSLTDNSQEMFGVVQRNQSESDMRVTSLERTLVDVLDRPDLTGSWEEIWQSLESVEFFDLNKITGYVRLLGNATTAAKVGFFLDQHRETLFVEEHHLKPLREMRPQQPHYFERSNRNGGRLVKEWNLIVPQEIRTQTWAEVL